MLDQIQQAKLYGILDLGYVAPSECERVTQEMLHGGVQIIQLRAKKLPKENIVPLARRIAPICRDLGVPFILNDHPELVSDCDADGVHVGQDDLGVAQARALAGEGKIVGLSTHSLAQATQAVAQSPDYIGFGPLFSTPTKPDYIAIGTDDIHAVHQIVPLPIFCIGGIKRENLPQVLSAGARRVVIVSGILQAENIAGYTRECLQIVGNS